MEKEYHCELTNDNITISLELYLRGIIPISANND